MPIIYSCAALCEIAGCFTFWMWLRSAKSALWLIPGCASLIAFAYLLTLIDTSQAGRAYAAYGGIYITASVLWLWIVEDTRPDLWDLCGTSLCIIGAGIIFFAPHRQ
ncbi:YnfA family protein [Neokomagataea tanensis]|uniref:YnfA family protein n=2 Tax=Acetobacteraceae TaxID=433 RepID=A0A4Y6V6X3_9PROT|nr:YnfA family protein [Neokomagataea tanensis]